MDRGTIMTSRPADASVRKCYHLCRSVLRNAAYYRGGESLSAKPPPGNNFAISARNNSLDLAIIDWCKIFADGRGKHNFKKILLDNDAFEAELLEEFRIMGVVLHDFIKNVARYRDKEVAHADVYDRIDIPSLEPIIQSTILLYRALRIQCGLEPQPVAPHDLQKAFQEEEALACLCFNALSGVAL